MSEKELSLDAGQPDPAGPMISVAMITYNHEAYIAQAIEGVLQQQTIFDYELIIGEDCSTDNTRNIVMEYAQKEPQTIRPLLPAQNLGMIPNFVSTLQACRGKYIAICEGDDFWTDPLKLQRQVDLLEAHPDYTLCFHTVTMFHEDNTKPVKYKPATPRKKVSGLEDILQGNFIHSCSVVFRHGLIGQFPAWFYAVPFPDWPLFVFCAQHGQIVYITEVMGAHRLHDGGSWTSKPQIEKLSSIVTLYQHFNAYLNHEYEALINAQIYKHSLTLTKKYANQGDLVAARKYWQQCMKLSPANFLRKGKQFVWLTSRIFTPHIYQAYKRVWV